MLTAAELAAQLRISVRQVQRHTADGMPYTPTGARGKVYDLDACSAWLRERFAACPPEKTPRDTGTPKLASAVAAFTADCRKVHLRVTPSLSRPS